MDILQGVPFYIPIANMLAKAVSLPKYMIVASAPNAPISIVQAQSDEPDISSDTLLDDTAYANIGRVDTNKMTLPIETGSFRPLQSQNINNVVNNVNYKSQ